MNLGTLIDGLGYFPLGNEAYPPLPDSRKTYVWYSEFIWVWYRCGGPSPISALPSKYYSEASPKAISGSTSYFRVWLVFRSYSQLIQAVFNPHWFGPPYRFTDISSWSRIDHTVSRLPHVTNALFGLAFAVRSFLKNLRCNIRVTRWLIKQKARSHLNKAASCSIRLLPFVGIWFQVLFHPPVRSTFHLSLTVLVHYRSLMSI